jgi:hypothetical protein
MGEVFLYSNMYLHLDTPVTTSKSVAGDFCVLKRIALLFVCTSFGTPGYPMARGMFCALI